MQRGEKRAMKYDDTSGASVGPAAKKPNKEKIPDFDWGTDNYALTKTLVNELRKPENRSVLFPDSDGMIVKVSFGSFYPPPPPLLSIRTILRVCGS